MSLTETTQCRFDAAADSEGWEWDGEARFVSRFRERIRFFAIRQVGPADAEDVAQETMRRVLVAIRNRRVRNLREPEAFVFQTARNICLQLHRSRSRESRAFDRYQSEPSEDLRRGDPLGDLLKKEARDSLAESLRSLSARDQALLRRFYRDGMDTAEVAGEMELTPEAVRVRKHRALRRLRSVVHDAWRPTGLPVPVG